MKGVRDGLPTQIAAEWEIGQRMGLDVAVDDSVFRQSFQRLVIGFAREDVQHIGDAATNDDTAITFEIAP